MKKQQEEEVKTGPVDEAKNEEVQELKKVFAPQPGIQRDNQGKLTVNKEEAVKMVKPQVLTQIAPQKAEQIREDTLPDEEEPPPEEKKKPALASKLGIGMRASVGGKIGVGLKGPAEKPGATAAGAKATTASDTAKEKALKKNEELKAKLESRQSEVKGPATTGPTRTTAAARPSAIAKDQPAKEPPAKPDVLPALKAGIKKLAGAGAAEPKASGQNSARPLTARQTVTKEETKAEPPVAPKRVTASR